MEMPRWTRRSLALRLGGAALLLGAWRVAQALEPIGREHAGHEPAIVWALCLLAFLLASAGAALLANGAALFGRVPMGALWTPHLHDGLPRAEPKRRA